MDGLFEALLQPLVEAVVAVVGEIFKVVLEVVLEVLLRIVLWIVALPVFFVLMTPFVIINACFGGSDYSTNIRSGYRGLWDRWASFGFS